MGEILISLFNFLILLFISRAEISHPMPQTEFHAWYRCWRTRARTPLSRCLCPTMPVRSCILLMACLHDASLCAVSLSQVECRARKSDQPSRASRLLNGTMEAAYLSSEILRRRIGAILTLFYRANITESIAIFNLTASSKRGCNIDDIFDILRH